MSIQVLQQTGAAISVSREIKMFQPALMLNLIVRRLRAAPILTLSPYARITWMAEPPPAMLVG